MGISEYAIELLFDETSETRILETFRRLKSAGFGLPETVIDYHPHITLNVCQVLDFEGLERYIKHFAKKTQALALEFSYLGAFPAEKSVLFLGPTIKQLLFDVHSSFLEGARHFIQATRTYYEPNLWVPHCTLAFGLSNQDLTAAFGIAAQTLLPLGSRLNQLSLVAVPSGKMLYTYPLKP